MIDCGLNWASMKISEGAPYVPFLTKLISPIRSGWAYSVSHGLTVPLPTPDFQNNIWQSFDWSVQSRVRFEQQESVWFGRVVEPPNIQSFVENHVKSRSQITNLKTCKESILTLVVATVEVACNVWKRQLQGLTVQPVCCQEGCTTCTSSVCFHHADLEVQATMRAREDREKLSCA